MLSIFDLAMVLLVVGLIVFLIPYVILTLIYAKIPKKKPNLVSLLFLGIFFISLIGGSQILASNNTSPDLSVPFSYNGSNLGENDMQSLNDSNIAQSASMLNKIANYNFTDPLAFLYQDIPHKGFNTGRSIQIVHSNKLSYSNYYLNTSDGLIPTLLRVNTSLLPFDSKEELKNYALNYLNPESKKITGIISVDVENRVPALGETYRELIIRFYDNESSNMILVDLSYDLGSGLSETVNIVFATSAYTFDKPSTVYLETMYSVLSYQNSFIYVLLNIASIVGLLFWLIFVYVKRSTTSKSDYQSIRQYTGPKNQ